MKGVSAPLLHTPHTLVFYPAYPAVFYPAYPAVFYPAYPAVFYPADRRSSSYKTLYSQLAGASWTRPDGAGEGLSPARRLARHPA